MSFGPSVVSGLPAHSMQKAGGACRPAARHVTRVEVEPDGEQARRGRQSRRESRNNGSCLLRSGRGRVVTGTGFDAIAAVEHGQQAAEGHQAAAAPDPVDEGFVIDADRPFAFRLVAVNRFAKRDINVIGRPASMAASVIGICEEW